MNDFFEVASKVNTLVIFEVIIIIAMNAISIFTCDVCKFLHEKYLSYRMKNKH